MKDSFKFVCPHADEDTVYTYKGHTLSWDATTQGGDEPGSMQVDPDIVAYNLRSGWWQLVDEEEEEIEVAQAPSSTRTNAQIGAITSDGRSSTYYDISLPNWLIARVLERYEDGRAYIKTEELIEVAFNDDFDAGNAFKSLVRLWGAFNGAGKAGNSVSYEKNKIEYSIGKLEQRYKRQEVAA